MKQNHLIHNNNWNYLTGTQIVKLFDEHFNDVEIQPNYTIVNNLQGLESATLECLEDRTASTVYRIKQTGVVYQICQPNGDTFDFEDYEDYLNADPVDELIESYTNKPVKFVIEDNNGTKTLVHKKPPRFKAIIDKENEQSLLQQIEWIDEQPNDVMQIAKLMRKAGAFIKNYVK